jgi:hypothetical protein
MTLPKPVEKQRKVFVTKSGILAYRVVKRLSLGGNSGVNGGPETAVTLPYVSIQR